MPEPAALSPDIRVRPPVTAEERVEEDVRAEVPTLVRFLTPVLVRPFTPVLVRLRAALLLLKDVALLLPADVLLPTEVRDLPLALA